MRRYLLCVGLTAIVHAGLSAQDLAIIHEEMIYKQVSGQSLKAHVFYTPQSFEEQNRPAIAFFHGGGWAFGSPDEFFGACKRYARKGFITISFQYRLSINEDGTYPHPEISPIESVKDARSAVRWLRENGKALRIDPEKIAVGGQSAGGQLALSTALMTDIDEDTDDLRISPEPNALLLYSSCVNTMEPWIDNLLGDRRERIWDISPHHNLKAGMPPSIAFHGDSDCTVLFYSVRLFSQKIKELGNSFELVVLEGRDHYLGEGGEEAYAGYFDEDILVRTDEFFRTHGFMD